MLSGEMVFLREESSPGYLTPSRDHIHTDDIIESEKAIFRNIYVYTCTCMHAITNSEKKGYEFEGEWGRTI